jgi:hypothetical protein
MRSDEDSFGSIPDKVDGGRGKFLAVGCGLNDHALRRKKSQSQIAEPIAKPLFKRGWGFSDFSRSAD